MMGCNNNMEWYMAQTIALDNMFAYTCLSVTCNKVPALHFTHLRHQPDVIGAMLGWQVELRPSAMCFTGHEAQPLPSAEFYQWHSGGVENRWGRRKISSGRMLSKS
jgi:hypothetical protein